jgi:DNA polymerase-3 subunit gamma/tau
MQFGSSRNQRLTIELALVKLANLSEVSKKKTVTEAENLAEPKSPPQSLTQEAAPEPVTTKLVSEPVAIKPVPEPVVTIPALEDDGNSLVRTKGISIKESLKGAPAPVTPLKVLPSDPEVLEQPADEKPAVTDPDAIIHAWNQYAASIEKSKPRIYSTLIHNRPVVRADGAVMVLLNSESQRDNFIKNIKSGMVSYIQHSTGLSTVEIITEVSESAQNGTKIYTEQDKLDFLVRKNPELAKLKSRFNLDFDD